MSENAPKHNKTQTWP